MKEAVEVGLVSKKETVSSKSIGLFAYECIKRIFDSHLRIDGMCDIMINRKELSCI